MEIKTNTLNELDIQSTGKVSNMKLDEDSQAMIFQMFTGGLYSDPIGTVIREIASNCFDSHVEAGVDSTKNPVIVELIKDVSSNFIIFKDSGVGMSPDRIENIYGTYFKSTKRATNDQIGGFGLGGKTPLAYTDSFYIVTRFEGIEYTYNVFEGNNVPAIELMSQNSTKLANGTDVRIPIKESDVREFEQKTLRQLYYFENIVFKGFSDDYVSNDYSIVKGKNFLFRGKEYANKMHVCYGKVAYPIDYDAMGLDSSDYALPIAVRIEIGELEGTGVTPSREAIKYTKSNIKTIQSKMDGAIVELREMITKQYNDVVTLEDYYRAKEDFGTLYFDDNRSIYIGNIIKQSEIDYPKFKFSEFRSIPSQSDIIEKFYDVKLYGKKYQTRSWRGQIAWNESLDEMSRYQNIYYVNDEFNRKMIKQSYLRTLVSTENFYVLIPKKFDVDEMNALMTSFGFAKEKLGATSLLDDVQYEYVVSKKKADKLVKDLYNELHAIIKRKSQANYDDVEVTEEFLEARKSNRLSPEILKTTINISDAAYGGSQRFTLEVLKKFNGRIYYGCNDDRYVLREHSNTFRTLVKNSSLKAIWNLNTTKKLNKKGKVVTVGGEGTVFVVVSKTNEKYMKMLGKKAIHIDYFYHTFIARKIDKIVENRLNYKLNNSYSSDVLGLFKQENFKYINEEVYNTCQKIEENIVDCDHRYGSRVSIEKIKTTLKIDIDSIKIKFSMQKELDKLIDLTKKNENRLKWFNLPYKIDLGQEDHKELVSMIQLMFEK